MVKLQYKKINLILNKKKLKKTKNRCDDIQNSHLQR